MTDEKLIALSVENLKKALPLMMRYNVPTTPPNYALWYTYVSNEIPELNSRLNNLIAKHDELPPIQAETLHQEFVAGKDEANNKEMQLNIESMLAQLDQSLDDTSIHTKNFQKAVGETVIDIQQANKDNYSVEGTLEMLKSLEDDSKNMHLSTQCFGKSLAIAKSEIESLKIELEKSKKNSFYDVLTGLLNRRALNLEFECFLEQDSPEFCLIIADIDHFKKFNDRWGHIVGDQVLKLVAKRLSDNMSNGATAYRFGGEEFVILLPKSELNGACRSAEKLRKLIATLVLKDKRTTEKINSITASFGVAEFVQGDSLTSLISRADECLYQAKNSGRNKVLPECV